MPHRVTTVRLPDPLIRRLDELVPRLAAEAGERHAADPLSATGGGREPSRGDVIRVALEIGAAALEERLPLVTEDSR